MAATEAERAEARRRAREQFDREYGGSKATDEPSSRDTYGIEQRCEREWASDPSLRTEFGGRYESFLAFKKAEAKGLIRIFGGRRREA